MIHILEKTSYLVIVVNKAVTDYKSKIKNKIEQQRKKLNY